MLAAACAHLGLGRLDAADVEELVALASVVSSMSPGWSDARMDEPGVRLLTAVQVATSV